MDGDGLQREEKFGKKWLESQAIVVPFMGRKKICKNLGGGT
jgi:hypothetical protein